MAAITYKGTYSGEDIHLIRNGKDFDLKNFINIDSNTTYYYFPSFAVNLSRYPDKDNYPNPANNFAGLPPDQPEQDGVNVNRTTGIITASTFVGSILPNFFIVIVNKEEIKDSNDNVINVLYDHRKIIVHVHDSIESIRLTPPTLTLRKDTGAFKYNVIAKFASTINYKAQPYTNNVYGDITNYPDLSVTLGTTSTVHLNTDSSLNVVGTPTPQTLPDIVTVTTSNYLLNSSNNALTATGSLKIAAPLSTICQVEKVGGTKLSDTHVLITCDGINNKAKFDRYVDDFISGITNDNYLSPWKYLTSSVDFWKLYIPSEESCVAFSEEVVVLSQSNTVCPLSVFVSICDNIIRDLVLYNIINIQKSLNLTGTQIREIIKRRYDTAQPIFSANINWASITTLYTSNSITLSDLITYVGLPVNSDTNKILNGDPLNDDKIHEWQNIPTFPNNITIENGVFEMWKKLINRKYLEHTNTALGMRVDGKSVATYNLNGNRLNKINLNKIISGLEYEGNNIGHLFFNTNGTLTTGNNGKQSNGNNVIVLTNGWNAGKFAAMNIRSPNGNLVIATILTPLGNLIEGNVVFSTDTNNVPQIPTINSLSKDTIYRSVHEFSHNFLEDEYSIKDNTPLDSGNTAVIEQTKKLFNLQSKKLITNSNHLQSNLTKWVIPRIKKIAIISAISGTSPNFTITISAEHDQYKFKQGDIIILRTRKLKPHSFFDNAFDDGSSIPNTKYGGKMRINSRANNDLSVTLETGEVFNRSHFPTGSLIICASVDVNGSIEHLIHKDVITIMDNANAGMFEIDTNHNRIQGRSKNFFTGMKNGNGTYYNIVGLYAGGQIEVGLDYTSNLYHPAGACIMRNASAKYSNYNINTLDDKPLNMTISDLTYPKIDQYQNYFCPVCRYILIDEIDPLQHPKNDADFQKDYPVF